VLENLTESVFIPIPSSICATSRPPPVQYWKNHFSTIGLVGMNESCLNFLGQDIASPEGLAFSKEVMDFFSAIGWSPIRKRAATFTIWKQLRPKCVLRDCPQGQGSLSQNHRGQ
jgi:hypothetical protein